MMRSMMRRVCLAAALATGCGGSEFRAAPSADGGAEAQEGADAPPSVDGGAPDRSDSATAPDGQRADSAGRSDSEDADADASDAGSHAAEAASGDADDAPATDAGPQDAPVDAIEGGDGDAGLDTGAADAGVDAQDTGAADAGVDAQDTSPDAQDAAGDAEAEACGPVLLLFLDGDGDGYGGTTTYKGCSAPAQGAWVTTGGDCDDSNAMVNPGQSAYFATGFIPTGKTDASFDYNCDGQESESGGPAKASCHLAALSCVGSGYVEASPARGGPGVDPFCGSAQAVTCAVTSLVCQAGAPYAVSPIACH